MARDFGYNLTGKVWGDANAALGIIQRKGLGRTRHTDTSYLWIQQVVAERRLAYGNVFWHDNPADLFTKPLDIATSERHVHTFNCRYQEGRSAVAPELYWISMSWDEHIRRQPEYNVLTLEKASRDIQSRVIKQQCGSCRGSGGYLMTCIRRRDEWSSMCNTIECTTSGPALLKSPSRATVDSSCHEQRGKERERERERRDDIRTEP